MAIFQKKKSRGSSETPGNVELNWKEENSRWVQSIQAGKIEEALTIGLRLVDHIDRTCRKDSKEKATTYNNIGMVFMLNRDYELADQSFREALAMRIRLFGETHNEVAVILLNLAELYKRRAQEIMTANRVEAAG